MPSSLKINAITKLNWGFCMHVYHTHIEALVLVLVLCIFLSDKHMVRVIGVQWNPITKGKKASGATVKGSRKSVGTGQRGPLLLERLKGPHVPDIQNVMIIVWQEARRMSANWHRE